MGLREFVSDPRFQSKDPATKRAMLLDYGVAESDIGPLLNYSSQGSVESSAAPAGSVTSALGKATSISAPAPLDRTGSLMDAAMLTNPVTAFLPKSAKDKIKEVVGGIPIIGGLSDASVTDAVDTLPQAGSVVGGAVGVAIPLAATPFAPGALAGTSTGSILGAGAGRMAGKNLRDLINLALNRNVSPFPTTPKESVKSQAGQFAAGAAEQAVGEGMFRGGMRAAKKAFPIPRSVEELKAAGEPELAMAREAGAPVLEGEGRGRELDSPSQGFLANLYERLFGEKRVIEGYRNKYNQIAGETGLEPIDKALSKGDLEKQISRNTSTFGQSQANALKAADREAARAEVVKALSEQPGLGAPKAPGEFSPSAVGSRYQTTTASALKAEKGRLGAMFNESEEAIGPKTPVSNAEAIKSLLELPKTPERDYAISLLRKRTAPSQRGPMPFGEEPMPQLPRGPRNEAEKAWAEDGTLDAVDEGAMALVHDINVVNKARKNGGIQKDLLTRLEGAIHPDAMKQRFGLRFKELGSAGKILGRRGERDLSRLADELHREGYIAQDGLAGLKELEDKIYGSMSGTKYYPESGQGPSFDGRFDPNMGEVGGQEYLIQAREIVDDASKAIGEYPAKIREALIKDKGNPIELKVRRYIAEHDPHNIQEQMRFNQDTEPPFEVGSTSEGAPGQEGFPWEPQGGAPQGGGPQGGQGKPDPKKDMIPFKQFRDATKEIGAKIRNAPGYAPEKYNQSQVREARVRMQEALTKQMRDINPDAADLHTAARAGYRDYIGKYFNPAVNPALKSGAEFAPEKVISRINPTGAEQLRALAAAGGPEGKAALAEGIYQGRLLKGGVDKFAKNLGNWSDDTLLQVFDEPTVKKLREIANKQSSGGSGSPAVNSELSILRRALSQYRQPTYNSIGKALFGTGGAAVGAGMLTGPAGAGSVFTAAELAALMRTMSAYGSPVAKAGRTAAEGTAQLSRRLPVSLDALISFNNAKRNRKKQQEQGDQQ